MVNAGGIYEKDTYREDTAKVHVEPERAIRLFRSVDRLDDVIQELTLILERIEGSPEVNRPNQASKSMPPVCLGMVLSEGPHVIEEKREHMLEIIEKISERLF